MRIWLNVYESSSRGQPFENAIWDAFIANANAIVLKIQRKIIIKIKQQ